MPRHKDLTAANMHKPLGHSSLAPLDLITNTSQAYHIRDATTLATLFRIDTVSGGNIGIVTGAGLFAMQDFVTTASSAGHTLRIMSSTTSGPKLHKFQMVNDTGGVCTMHLLTNTASAGFVAGDMRLNLGLSGTTATNNPRIQFNSGDGTNAKFGFIEHFSASTGGILRFNSEGTTVTSSGSLRLETKAVGTSSTTPTDIWTHVLQTGETIIIFAMVFSLNSTNSAGYLRCATFENTGGTVTQVGTTEDIATQENAAGSDCTIIRTGTTIQIQVTADSSATTNHRCSVWYQKTNV